MAGIRAIKTEAQTAIATIGASAMVRDVNRVAVAFAAALSGILSLLSFLAGLPELKLSSENYAPNLSLYGQTECEFIHQWQAEGSDTTNNTRQNSRSWSWKL